MGIEKANNCETVEDVYARLKELEEETRLISSSEDLYELEQEIISYTNRLASLLLKKKVQLTLNSPEQLLKEKELISNWPGRMKSEGFQLVQIQTRGG